MAQEPLKEPQSVLAQDQPLTFGSGQSSLPPPSANKPASSLFGNTATSQAQQTANTSQPQTSSLFGSLSQPQQTGGLFGSLNQSANNQQQSSTGGLFAPNNTQQSQPQPSGGLFGSLGQTQNQVQQPQTGLFGAINNQNKTSSLLCVSPSMLP